VQIMIDIERVPRAGRPTLVQIGAVSFEYGFRPHEAIELLGRDERWVNVVTTFEPAGDAPAEAFWASPERREALQAIDSLPVQAPRAALDVLSAFVGSYLGNRAMVWAKPPMHDLALLREMYVAEGLPCPWGWGQEGCLRTGVWLADRIPRTRFRVPESEAQGLIQHYALHDAARQVILAQSMYRALVENARDRGAESKAVS
jgi:hypothetical protein